MFIDKFGNHWYKGNLHTHTTRSDGKLSPDDTKRFYRSQGYDFLALTDTGYTARAASRMNRGC